MGRAWLDEPAVCRSKSAGPETRVVMADSKLLYSSNRGLRLLETGLLAALGLLGHCPRTWREVWQALRPRPWSRCRQSPGTPSSTNRRRATCEAEASRGWWKSWPPAWTGLACGCWPCGAGPFSRASSTIFAIGTDRKAAALSRATLALAARRKLPTGEGDRLIRREGAATLPSR